MSLEKRMRREKKKRVRKAAQRDYKDTRDLGPCYIKDCRNNGDMTDSCRFCDFKVQACTMHHPMGRQKAKQHLWLRHPTKTIPAVVMGVIRGQSLE